MTGEHLVPLPGSQWRVWRDALLRTTGFPVGGLDRFRAPEAARAADALLAGEIGAAAFAECFAAAARAGRRTAYELAGDPLFREAVTWQNPDAARALDGLRRSGPEPVGENKRTRYRRRIREDLVARYWQRYCAKNETVGFFGPVGWVRLDPDAPAALVKPGPGLVRQRRVWFEQWALAVYAAGLAADPGLRPFLPVRQPAHHRLAGTEVIRPAQPPVPLSAAEAAVLARCDGRPAAAIAAELIAELAAGPAGPAGQAGPRRNTDVYLLLERLAGRGLVEWGIDVPLNPDAEQVLAAALDRLQDAAAASGPGSADTVAVARAAAARAGFDRLRAARDAVAAAAGDPDALAAALAELDRRFAGLAGPTRRRPGQMYAGRALCYEDTVRDLDVVLGGPVLAALAAPLELLLRAARWLTAAIADAYRSALRELYEELAAEHRAATIPLGPLWYLAQGPLFGAAERPADRVTAEFVRRWSDLFGLDRVGPDVHRIDLASADLAGAVAERFPADRPGWSGARLHSPDVTICAPSVEAINRGEFSLVLGELHAAWATVNCAVFVLAHEEPDRLRSALREDLGTSRVLLRFPADFPRYTGRVARYLDGGADVQLGFAPAPPPTVGAPLPVTALTVSAVDGELVAAGPGGRSWPLLEVFGELVAMHAVEAFKLVAAAPRTPRITVDRLVVSRETWRTTVGASGLAGVTEYADRFLAGRRWRRALGLPERVFVRIATETKPVYVDFSAPRYVSALCTMVRSAQAAGGDAVPLTVTEMLPTPDQAWVPDADGRRYFSELRIQVRDPEPAR